MAYVYRGKQSLTPAEKTLVNTRIKIVDYERRAMFGEENSELDVDRALDEAKKKASELRRASYLESKKKKRKEERERKLRLLDGMVKNATPPEGYVRHPKIDIFVSTKGEVINIRSGKKLPTIIPSKGAYRSPRVRNPGTNTSLALNRIVAECYIPSYRPGIDVLSFKNQNPLDVRLQNIKVNKRFGISSTSMDPNIDSNLDPDIRWRKLEGFSSYAVSENGDVYNLEKGSFVHQISWEHKRKKKPTKTKIVRLRDDRGRQKSLYVHRLVGALYIDGFGPYDVVDFKDGDYTNTKIDNLYITGAVSGGGWNQGA